MRYKAKRLRVDVGYVVSAVLLVAVAITVATGVVADVWDLNDFIYHRWAGYAMAGAALIHVILHWNRMAGYVRRRLRRGPSRHRAEADPSAGPRTTGEIAASAPTNQKESLRSRLSRRGFLGLAVGGLSGWFLGRRLGPPDLPYGSDVGEIYHEWSKPTLMSLLGTVTSWGQQPAKYKEYPGAERILLPSPGSFRGLYTEDAIEQRRSGRNYTGEPFTLDELSRLLYYTAGVTGDRWGSSLRAAPSAGALYPIEMYAVVHEVDKVEPGLYHYAMRDHALDRLRGGDLRGEIVRNGLMQGFLGEANVVLVFTGIFQRLRWKYQERTYRYALLEAGHLGQNVYLAATSMGMRACAVGAFLDDQLNGMLDVDGEQEAALYLLSVGNA